MPKIESSNSSRFEPYYLKKKISNKLKGAIENPSTYTNNILPLNGNINFNCRGKSDIDHKINITIDSNNLNFNCSCICDTNVQTESCNHLNAVIIKIFSDYINNCVKYNQNKQTTLNIKNELNDVINKLDGFQI